MGAKSFADRDKYRCAYFLAEQREWQNQWQSPWGYGYYSPAWGLVTAEKDGDGWKVAAELWGVSPDRVRAWCKRTTDERITQDKKGSPYHIPKAYPNPFAEHNKSAISFYLAPPRMTLALCKGFCVAERGDKISEALAFLFAFCYNVVIHQGDNHGYQRFSASNRNNFGFDHLIADQFHQYISGEQKEKLHKNRDRTKIKKQRDHPKEHF